jgi:hypothetical protein
MNQSNFSRFVLAADLFICAIWLMLALHVGSAAYYPLLWIVPVLRMWLSFLTYRRSRMALTPLLLLVVFCLRTLLNHANPVFMLFNRPMLTVVKSLTDFFGSGHFDLAKFSDIWYVSWDYRYCIAGIAYVCRLLSMCTDVSKESLFLASQAYGRG